MEIPILCRSKWKLNKKTREHEYLIGDTIILYLVPNGKDESGNRMFTLHRNGIKREYYKRLITGTLRESRRRSEEIYYQMIHINEEAEW